MKYKLIYYSIHDKLYIKGEFFTMTSLKMMKIHLSEHPSFYRVIKEEYQ